MLGSIILFQGGSYNYNPEQYDFDYKGTINISVYTTPVLYNNFFNSSIQLPLLHVHAYWLCCIVLISTRSELASLAHSLHMRSITVDVMSSYRVLIQNEGKIVYYTT